MTCNFVFAWGKKVSNTEFGCVSKEWSKVLKMHWPHTHTHTHTHTHACFQLSIFNLKY